MPARICGAAFHGRYRLTESANRDWYQQLVGQPDKKTMQLKNRKFKRWQFAMQIASCGYGLKPPVNRLNTRRNRERLRVKWWNLANEDVMNHIKTLIAKKRSAGLSNGKLTGVIGEKI